ncbi:MAG: ParB/RepB/Spo0J family partition protein, partial [Miltoncostaeaceae bacterium]
MAEIPPRDRRGLGRGLAALLGEDRPGSGPQEAPPRLVELTPAQIAPNPDQPRATIAEEALEALAASIAASGLLQPVVERPPGPDGVHELIAGERRWRAAQRAGLDRIPAIVRAVDDRESVEFALAENLVREDLSPIDVAQACACLIEDFGQSQADLARRLGRSRPAIANLIRLLELPEEVQGMLARGEITEGHGRAVLQADGPARRTRLAERVRTQGLSVRATESLARTMAAPGEATGRPAPEPPSPLGDTALDVFSEAFDAPVRVRRSARG